MCALPAELTSLLPLLPTERVGVVERIEPLTMGLSGAGVYAVTAARGAFVLRVQGGDAPAFARQVRLLRRVAGAGIAPALVHVDEAAQAVLSARVAGRPLGAALADPAQRPAALASVVEQLRALHALQPADIDIGASDPVGFARAAWDAARTRPGFPSWAAALAPVLDTAAALLAADPRRVVSHNDVNPGNILWDGARAWLVDWEVAGLNHPHYDLAVFAMFLRLDDDSAFALAAHHDGTPLDQPSRATFQALRRLAAALCGLTFLRLVDDLSVRPSRERADAPSLGDCYAAMRSGQFDLRAPRDRASFGLALLAEAVP